MRLGLEDVEEGTEPDRANGQRTDAAAGHEQGGLKAQPRRAVRVVSIAHELITISRRHTARYGLAPYCRLFCTQSTGQHVAAHAARQAALMPSKGHISLIIAKLPKIGFEPALTAGEAANPILRTWTM